MTLDPTQAWAIVKDGEILHLRTQLGVAEACALIEQTLLNHPDSNTRIKVVPVLITEIEDMK